MKCLGVGIKRRRVCNGDLNRQIVLHIRSITPPDDADDFDWSQTLTVPVTVWSGIQTLTGKEIFDGVNLIGVATHVFYIRYKSGLTSEAFLEWDSKYFRILTLEDLDENKEYMALFCSLRGDKTIEVNTQ